MAEKINTIVKNWDGKEFTLDELLDICKQADTEEVDFDQLMDGDLATVPCIIRDLVNRIKAYESCSFVLSKELEKTWIEDNRREYDLTKLDILGMPEK